MAGTRACSCSASQAPAPAMRSAIRSGTPREHQRASRRPEAVRSPGLGLSELLATPNARESESDPRPSWGSAAAAPHLAYQSPKDGAEPSQAALTDGLGPRLGPAATFATTEHFTCRPPAGSPLLRPTAAPASISLPRPAPSASGHGETLAPSVWQLTLTAAGMVAVVNSVVVAATASGNDRGTSRACTFDVQPEMAGRHAHGY